MVFTCEHCHYTTNLKYSFTVHMKSKRHLANVTSPPQYRCPVCEKGFTTTRGLSKHLPKCQHNEATDVSNTIVSTKVITKEMFDSLQEKVLLLETALMECMRRQAVIDGSNSLPLFQTLFDSCGNIVIAGGSNYMNSHNNNTHNNNNLNLNMFLDKCNDVQDMVDYIDT
jgi:Zinc finger, C2H2 type